MIGMATTTKQLEARLARVERELAELREAVAAKSTAQPWYQQIVGSFAGDEAFAEIIRLGRLIRAGKNPK
jgi:hypothetical protein